MEPGGDTPPFWSQPTTTLLPRRHRRPPSPLLNPVALILAIPIIFLLLLFFIMPPFISHANQFLKPNSVKKSWDSFNILLVLFAVLCGIFARRNDDVSSTGDSNTLHQNSDNVSIVTNSVNIPTESLPSWLDFVDRKEYNNVTANAAESGGGGSRLKRSSSSYPDLRQESLWESGGGNKYKFFDDFEVDFYRSPPPENLRRREKQIYEAARKEVETPVQEISVDKFEIAQTRPKSPPPPPPPSADTLKRRRSFHSVPNREEAEMERNEAELSENGPPAPPTPPPPPAAEPELQFPEAISENRRRKKNGTTKEIATAIVSLYNGQKRKRKRKLKSRNIYENTPQNSSLPSTLTPPPPPPPPPPPSSSSKVLQNLFKKSGKNKRVHSVSAAAGPPPAPPPPPPNSIFNNLFKSGSKSNRFQPSSTTHPPPPPPPPPSSILNSLFKNGSKSFRFKNFTTAPPPPPPPPPRRREPISGKPPKPNAEFYESLFHAPPSPLIPMPPPPPPPPFRMREVKFVAQGDFVKIRSEQSSRCSSPELEDFDVVSVKSEGGDSIGPSVGPSITCPSPDVNMKADNFIARLRDEWRLDKVNSMKEKRNVA